MMKRFGNPPQPGKRYTLRPGAYAVLPKNGRLLLTEQAPGPELQLPGGGIDPGENPLAALHREVMEETGWKIANPVRLGAFRRFTFMPEYDLWAEKLCVIYCARPVRKLGEPTEPGHRAMWLEPVAAAQQLDNPGDAHFVRNFCL